jgi:predicted O-methyltransferase YrrM
MAVVFCGPVRYLVPDALIEHANRGLLAEGVSMARRWTSMELLDVVRSFQTGCILAAGVTLDVFTRLHEKPATARALASRLDTDLRATTILLDALAALGFLEKQSSQYSAPEDLARLLSERSAENILPMARHQANCLRRWAELPRVVRTGSRPEPVASVRGAAADQADFIGAMHNISKPIADEVVGKLQPLKFRHLLDIGGGPGTWTIAFLRAVPAARATLFDLPPVVAMAKQRLAEAGLLDRATLVGGDFYADDLPAGADLVWLGAICHQNSRQQNRDLFAKAFTALGDGGALVIRDVVMEPSRIAPASGALFAVNMLTATEAGGTYTFKEYSEDLRKAGFGKAVLVHQDEFMSSLIRARKAKK